MLEPVFSQWCRWKSRGSLEQIRYPGIYVIAVDDSDISGKEFDWLETISYVGMTISIGGLASRLRQFDRTILGKRKQHGGADRFRYRHQDYGALTANLYVAIAPYPCDPSSDRPEDLRIMGDVAKREFECQARYVEIHGHLPEFNDQTRSPKFSLTIGRVKSMI